MICGKLKKYSNYGPDQIKLCRYASVIHSFWPSFLKAGASLYLVIKGKMVDGGPINNQPRAIYTLVFVGSHRVVIPEKNASLKFIEGVKKAGPGPSKGPSAFSDSSNGFSNQSETKSQKI